MVLTDVSNSISTSKVGAHGSRKAQPSRVAEPAAGVENKDDDDGEDDDGVTLLTWLCGMHVYARSDRCLPIGLQVHSAAYCLCSVYVSCCEHARLAVCKCACICQKQLVQLVGI